MSNDQLTIVIPVYNEKDNIATAIDKIEEKVIFPHEIKIVYDFEEDSTIPVVKELQKRYSNIILTKNKYGKGALNAIKTGLESDNSKYVIVTMADLSDPPEVINDMCSLAEKENADIVCGSRYMRGGKHIGGPIIKSLMSRIAGISLHYLARIPTFDATNSFKLYKTSFLKTQTIESSGGFELGVELVAKAYVKGFKIVETPTTWMDRSAGESRFKLVSWTPKYLKWYFYAFKGLL